MVAVIVNSSADERSIAEMHARSMGGYYIWLRGYKMDYTIPRFFVEIRRSFENFLLKMTIYMHSASQFPVFVVSVVRSLGFLRQKKFSTRIKGDARFFIVDAL